MDLDQPTAQQAASACLVLNNTDCLEVVVLDKSVAQDAVAGLSILNEDGHLQQSSAEDLIKIEKEDSEEQRSIGSWRVFNYMSL